jgi:sensor domain CHASE-containing protein
MLFIDAFSMRTMEFSCFILLVLLVVRIAIESVHASHENRSLGDEQLDDGIADTLVGETQFAPLTWAERPL